MYLKKSDGRDQALPPLGGAAFNHSGFWRVFFEPLEVTVTTSVAAGTLQLLIRRKDIARRAEEKVLLIPPVFPVIIL
jgi:hypothetical protein